LEERPWRLLFVCTGNICRSPMAEGLARAYATGRGRAVEVRSGGTMGIVDHPADPKAVAVCGEIDVDIARHRSSGIDAEVIAWADYVLVMEYAHATWLRERFPDLGEKLLLLGSFAGVFEIADPLGGWKFQFRRSREEIRRCVEAFVDRLPPKAPPA
jgi:protein-tyrosine-phosphatase